MPYPLYEGNKQGDTPNKLHAADIATMAKIFNDLKVVGLDFKKTTSGLGWKITLKLDETTLTFDTDAITIKVKDGGIDTAQLADDAVDKAKIAADVAGTGLAQNADGSLEVNPDGTTLENSGDTVQVKALGIDTAQLAASAVETAKINNGAVTSDKTTGATGSASTSVPGTTLTITNGLITAIT